MFLILVLQVRNLMSGSQLNQSTSPKQHNTYNVNRVNRSIYSIQHCIIQWTNEPVTQQGNDYNGGNQTMQFVRFDTWLKLYRYAFYAKRIYGDWNKHTCFWQMTNDEWPMTEPMSHMTNQLKIPNLSNLWFMVHGFILNNDNDPLLIVNCLYNYIKIVSWGYWQLDASE